MCVYVPAWRQKHDSDNCCELPNTKFVGHYKTLQVTSFVVSWCLSDLNRTELLCPGDPLKWSSPAMTGPNVFKTTFNLLLVMQNGTWRKRKAHSAEAWAALLVFLFLWWRKGKVWVSSSDVIAVPVINYGFLWSPSTSNNLQFWWGGGRSQFVLTMLLLYYCFLTFIFFVVTLNLIYLRHLLKRKSGIHPLTFFFRFTPFIVFNKRQFGVSVGKKMKIAAVTANGIIPRGPP